MNPASVLRILRNNRGTRLHLLPTSSGLYALRDHSGAIRYVGIAHSEGFLKRIRHKHATGSEDRSHKFSAAYNSGRLWRDRHSSFKADGAVSKRVRRYFILKHCTASFVEIASYQHKSDLEEIERQVIELASPEETRWRGKFDALDEPVELVDALIADLRLSAEERAALDRQRVRFLERLA